MTSPSRSVELGPLLRFAAVLAGLALIVVGVWARWGWELGLVALGVVVVAVVVWPEGKGTG